MSNKKLLVLPGDGVGPEVMREVRRVIDWMDRRRVVSFDITEGPRRGREHRPGGHAHQRGDDGARQGGGCRAVRERGRARAGRSWGSTCGRRSPSCGCARSWTCSRTCGRRWCWSRLVEASTLKAGCGAGVGPHDRAGEHGRDLFRGAAGGGDAGRRAGARIRHRDLHNARNRAGGAGSVRAGAQAPGPRDERREGERDAERAVLAPGGDGRCTRGNIRTCSWGTCMRTTAPCNWCGTRGSST